MEVTTREWISFFQEARIPRTAAAQYAMTFVENRITMDMLLDLNKASTKLLSSAFYSRESNIGIIDYYYKRIKYLSAGIPKGYGNNFTW